MAISEVGGEVRDEGDERDERTSSAAVSCTGKPITPLKLPMRCETKAPARP